MCRNKNRKMEKKPYQIKSLIYNDCLGPNNPNIVFLNQITENDEVRNIAVIGPYGSGKSSIIHSYLKCNDKNQQSIFFSNDTFMKYYDEEGKDWIKKALYCELLKASINSFDFNKYLNDLENKSKRRKFKGFLHSLILVFSTLVFFICKYYLNWLFSALAFLVSVLLLYLISSSFKISKIIIGKDKINQTKLDAKEEKSMLEVLKNNPVSVETVILDIIKKRRIEYFVIEDIDRIDEQKHSEGIIVSEMLDEFKRLSDLVKRKHNSKVIFFFALSDKFFDDSEKRSKGFDAILPVVSLANSTNASNVIETDVFIAESFKGFDKQVIYDLAPYFDNQRQINALLEEFYVYMKQSSGNRRPIEIFALCCLNVLYPDFYHSLSKKSNFLLAFFKEINDGGLTIDEFSSVKAFGNLVNFYDDKKRSEFLLFLKTCLHNKYITENFASFMVMHCSGEISNEDNEFRMKCRAGEDVLNIKVQNPRVLLANDKTQSLISSKTSLNIYLIRYVVTKGKKIEKDKLKSVIKTIDNIEYISKIVDSYCNEFFDDEDALFSLSSFVSDLLIFYSDQINLSEEVKNKWLYFQSVSISATFYAKNILYLKKFVINLNDADYQSGYGDKYKSESLKKILGFDEFIINDVEKFTKNTEKIKIIFESKKIAFTYKNLNYCIDGFDKNPIQLILNNSTILNSLIDNSKIFEILDEIDISKNIDLKEDFIKLFSKISISQFTGKTSSAFFKAFEQKILIEDIGTTINLEKTKILLLANCLVVNATSYKYFVNNSATDFICNYIVNYCEYLKENKCILSIETTESLINKLSLEDFKKASIIMDLNVFNKYLSNFNEDIVTFILLTKDNKKEYFELVQTSNNLLINKILNANALKSETLTEVALSDVTIKSILSNALIKYFSLLDTALNSFKTLKILEANPSFCNESLFEIYFDETNQLKKKPYSIDLLLFVCCADSLNFDKKVNLIINCDENLLESEKWNQFINKYKRDQKGKYFYIENNENNVKFLHVFNNKCLRLCGERKFDNTIKIELIK